ncbi:MAG: carboxypeptidase-like regulatory domain-containing protein, partial [Eubacteriales bacterium]|nr:carboxypeptidase-like regulatory domain-containing protein [Eubacteriales bacterium]
MKEHKSVHKKSARLKRRCLAVMLVVCMVISIFPMIQLQNVYAGESFTISLTKVEQNTEIDATHFRPWNISISGNGSYTGTFYVIFGAAAGEEAARAYIKSNGIKFEEKTKIAGFDANIITNSSDDGGEHLMIMVTVTAPKTAQEIQNYLNNNISFVHNGITNANTMAAALKNWTYVPAINENTYVQPAEVTFSHTNGAGNESGNTGSGKVILNYGITSVELKQGTTANVPKDTSVTVKIQPTRSIDADTDSYVTGYKITGGNVNIEKNNLTSQKDYEETITATADMTISVVFEKKGNQPTAATNRPQGNLAWAKNIATNADVSYVDALKMSYNASVQNYILNSNFGTSWTYGVDLLANPKVYSTVSFNGGTPITVGAKDAFKDLGQLGGQYPTKNVQLGSNIKKTDIKPGLFTQTVESDYYTATGICSNHWYHVVGVEYHKDGMTRSFNILKDTLLITDVDSTYVYGSDVGAAVKAASEGIEGSQAIIDTQKVHKVFKDSNGNVVLDITKALPGNYTVEFTYDGDDFIQTYTSGLSKGFTITKAANTADAIAPMFTKTEKSITLANLYDGQLYSIDGTNWYTKAEIEANNPFVNLNEGTAYTVSTKIAATDTHEESAVNSSTSVTTDIMISGKINGEAAALPAVVTVSDGKNTYTVTTDNEGNYSKAVPAGVYSISVEGKDGLQNGTYTGTFNVSKDSKAVPAISMTDTAKGKARKFISENLGEGKDTITEVTADTLDKILNSKAKFDALTDPAVKAAINEWMNNLTNSDKTYEKLAEEANDFLNKTSDKFIKDHMTYDKGKVITEATKENFASILGGENDFNALTQKQKDDVNKKLKAAGAKPDTYEALLALAKQKVNENSDTFIK